MVGLFHTNALERSAYFRFLLVGPYAAFSSRIFPASTMYATMLGGRKKLKIFNAIVGSVFVDVVNVLIASKPPTKMTRHDKTVFVDVPIGKRIGMMWHQDTHIPVRVDVPSWLFSGASCFAQDGLSFRGSYVDAFRHGGQS